MHINFTFSSQGCRSVRSSGLSNIEIGINTLTLLMFETQENNRSVKNQVRVHTVPFRRGIQKSRAVFIHSIPLSPVMCLESIVSDCTVSFNGRSKVSRCNVCNAHVYKSLASLTIILYYFT